MLATSQVAAHRCVELIDELAISIPERRAAAYTLRELLVATLSQWTALYEAFPHAELDELRRSEPKARPLIGLATVGTEGFTHVMYAVTTGHAGREPLVWSSERALFFAAPGIVLAAAASDDRADRWLSNCDVGCDPGCLEVFSIADVVDCDPGCF